MNIFFIDQIGTLNYLDSYFEYLLKKKKSFKVYFSKKLKKIILNRKFSYKVKFVKANKFIINEIVEQAKPKKIILSSSGNSLFEKNIILTSKRKKIKTFSIVDTWDNFKERFRFNNKYYLPDCIMCIDNYSKKKLKKLFKKIDITVVGQPYLEKILYKK